MTEEPHDARSQQILGARFREAREARGWTQQQLAERLGMARTTVVAIEKGERRLRPEKLMEIASALGRSVSELHRRTDPVEGLVRQLREALPPSAPAEAEIHAGIEELQRLCEDYVHIEALCQAPLRQRYPAEYEIEGTDPELAAEDVAAAERSRLGLGEAPLVNLGELLEGDVGLRVFQLALPPQVESMYALTESTGGCLAVNPGHPPERRRASLARGYGHFLTARYRAEVVFAGRYERKPAGERFREAFARAFLLPATSLRRRFLEIERERAEGATVGDLLRLAHFYEVSVEAITLRLEELRLLPSGAWGRLSGPPVRLSSIQSLSGFEPISSEPEPFSSRYVALAIEAWQREEISEGQLARILRTSRVGARDRILRFRSAAETESDGGEAFDLGEPLLRAASR